MQAPLLTPLLLLVTVSALHLENDACLLKSLQLKEDQGQDLGEGSGEQKGELFLTKEEIQSMEEEDQDAFEDQEPMESSDLVILDDKLQCPKEEDTVLVQGNVGCKTCRYVLVKVNKTFKQAEAVCKNCYRGNLVSIHNYNINRFIYRMASKSNQAQVWTGGYTKCWILWKKFRWIDGSSWNYSNWASAKGSGRCVAMRTIDGRWQQASCSRKMPFVCLS
ncbi:proteoglycan 3 [Ochotona princeps]|uniref:proteoglycan 3 n=1 Tax=Ochotona princeps TaxID=9978 RepID=UPI002714CCAF|nr:proteoglycan 3 [Ochotona princeps]